MYLKQQNSLLPQGRLLWFMEFQQDVTGWLAARFTSQYDGGQTVTIVFACQADGDVIDFTSRLFGLSSKEAALKLAEDFSISFDRKGHNPPQKRMISRKISEEMRYRQAEQKCFRVLCDYRHLLERWKEEYAPKQPEDGWSPLFVEALHRQPYIEYLLDLLL